MQQRTSLLRFIFYRGLLEILGDVGLRILFLRLLCLCGSCSIDRLIDRRRLFGRLMGATVTR